MNRFEGSLGPEDPGANRSPFSPSFKVETGFKLNIPLQFAAEGEEFGKPKKDLDPVLKDDAIDWLLETVGRLASEMSQESAKGDYRIFTNPEERHELYTIGRRMSEYAVNEGVRAVYFMDRSARPAYVAMKEFWKVQYPDVPMPHIGFFNPKGFVSREDIADNKVDVTELTYNDKYKQGKIESLLNTRPDESIIQEIQAEMDEGCRTQPILVFDACIHTGNSIRPVTDKLAKAGLTDVRFGVVSPRNNSSGIQPDFEVMQKVPVGVCYPFDRDRLTEKTYTSIHAAPNITVASTTRAAVLRDEIRRSVQGFTNRPQRS